jgi:hypothetical protein
MFGLANFSSRPGAAARDGGFPTSETRAQRRYTQWMSTNAIVVAVIVATGLLGGCACARQPLDIGVTDEGFLVAGQALKTRGELVEAIRAAGATECRVTPSATSGYKQVETAVLAVQDSGCRSGIVGNVEP